MRRAGYAFHNLSGFLAKPAKFDRRLYVFSLRAVAFYWDALSHDLHLALGRVLGVDLERLEAIVRKEGFAGSMFA